MKLNELKVGELLEETRGLHARPGGGAISILTANLAVNLILMMDKKNFKGLEKEAEANRRVLKEISDLLTKCADEDIYYADILVNEFKKKGQVDKNVLIDALRPQIRLNTLSIRAMEVMAFFLEYGKKSTLADGEIANELIYSAIKASEPTIKMNLKDTNYRYNLEEVLKEAERLYQNNISIIERRKV